MSRKINPFRKKVLVTCVIAGLASNYAYSQQTADPEIEEFIITGSFIRGTPLDSPSPVQIIDRANIQSQGAATVWDVVKNLNVNSGSFADNGSGETYGIEGTAQINLRNLGENSTLTLINGKRMVPSGATTRAGGEFVDINSIPLVMTERLEILTDGGSALYGADAVAGVVNVIMRNDFEGLEVYGDLQGVQEASGQYDATLSAIWGWASDDGDTHFVVSGERMERDPVNIRDANFFNDNTQLITGGAGSPGAIFTSSFLGSQVNQDWVNQELRDLNQAERDIYRPGTTAGFAWTDPLCDSGLTDASGNQYFTLGSDPRQRARGGNRNDACVIDESQWALVNYESERNSIASSFDHTFGDGTTELYGFAMWSDQETLRGGSGYRGSFASYSFLPSAGAYRRFRHGQSLELGHFAPLFGMEKPLDITNNPADGINGGPNTAFNSSGNFNVTRPGGNDDTTFTETGNLQLGLRGEFEMADRVLNYDVSYSVGYSSIETKRRDFNRTNLHMAGVGLGGPDCTPNGRPDFDFLSYRNVRNPLYARNAWNIYEDTSVFDYIFEGYYTQTHEPISYGLTSTNQGKGDCMFYNPLLTSLGNSNVSNSPELMDWLTEVTAVKDRRNTQGVFDAVVTGELIEMRGGMSAFALGVQRRHRTANSHASDLNRPGITNAIQGYDHTQILSGTGPGTGLAAITGVPNEFGYVSNNMGGSFNSLEYDLERDVNAVFVELSVPFWRNVESQVALRYEDYGDNVGSEVSPKVALSWRPIESLLLRTSFSQSFRAPNLGIIGAGLDSSTTTYRDPLNTQQVRAGLLPPTNDNATLETTFTLGGPAPDVGNEYADTFSMGVIWTPGGALEGLSAQADFWRFEVTDRVLPENGSGAVARQVEAFTIAAANPDNYVLNSSLNLTSGLEPFQSCDPNAIEAEFGRDSTQRLDCVVDQRLYQVEGVEENVPSPNRTVIQLKLAAQNAGKITADGVDVKLGYRWANDWGRFNLGLDYTFVSQYEVSDVPGLDNGLLDLGITDAAGTTGDGNIVRSLPDHRGNITFNWGTGNHNATLINRYIGSYTDLTHDLRIAEVDNPFVASLMQREIDDYWRWDAQYSYTLNLANSNLGTARITAGIIDLFDADVPVRVTGGLGSLDFDPQVHDGRGRRFYVRALWSI